MMGSSDPAYESLSPLQPETDHRGRSEYRSHVRAAAVGELSALWPTQTSHLFMHITAPHQFCCSHMSFRNAEMGTEDKSWAVM